jgi:hypothetical protein
MQEHEMLYENAPKDEILKKAVVNNYSNKLFIYFILGKMFITRNQ